MILTYNHEWIRLFRRFHWAIIGQIAGVEKTVNLREPLPIYLAYFTAWEENGALKTVPDIYGRDHRHGAAAGSR